MHRLLPRFIRDTRGTVLIIFAFMLFFLVAVAGAGVDMGRSQIIKHKMHQATDAAALAGAAAGLGLSESERNRIVERVFRLNFPSNFMGSDVTYEDLAITYIPNAANPDSINIQLASEVQTSFMNTVGVDKVDINSETQVGIAATGPAQADIAMALDISGSMAIRESAYSCGMTDYTGAFGPVSDSGTRMHGLRQSVNNFIDDLIGDGPTLSENYSLGTVLYGRDTSPPIITSTGGVSGGPRVLVTKTYDNNLQAMKTFYLGTGSGNTGVLDSTNIMGPGTLGGLGAQTVHGMVNSSNRPYGTKDGRIQSVIFMTDGRNMVYDPSSTTRESDSPAQNTLFSNQCMQMKNAGVLVYTIAYGGDIVCFPQISTLLRDCASGTTAAEKADYFFEATDGNELDAAFTKIGASIQNIRIVK